MVVERQLHGSWAEPLVRLTAKEMVRSVTKAGGVILLDEHIAYLDPPMTEVVLRLTKELSCQQRFTVLMVTHNIHIAVKHGDRILVLKDRRIIYDKRYSAGVERAPEELFRLLS